jgi:hypothetical protein
LAAVESTSEITLSSEYLRLTIRSDRLTVAALVPLVRSISNQKSLRRLDEPR